MDRNELWSRLNQYCRDFVPEKPSGFSADRHILHAGVVAHPVELIRQLAPGDHLVRLDFHSGDDDRGMGPLERPRERLMELTRFLQDGNIHMAFGYEPGRGDDLHVMRDPADISNRDIWFIGDVHGDLLALRAALAFINSNSVWRPVYVFLGDLFDRNPFGLNVLMEVVGLLKDNPDSVFLIAGNHDDGLDCSGGGFISRIQPHQFADELNSYGDEEMSNFVQAFIKVVKTLPIGLVLPNGLLATHGGVPSRPERSVKNVWDGLDRDGIIRRIHACRSEFLNNRFQKDVSTGTKLAPEFSWLELVNFSKAVEKAYGVPVRSIVRGHDHCDLCRHEWGESSFRGNDVCPPERAECVRDALTMTTMVMMDGAEKTLSGFLRKNFSYPTVARYDADSTRPQVFTLMFDDGQVSGYLNAALLKCNIEHARMLVGRQPSIKSNLSQIEKELEREKTLTEERRKKLEDGRIEQAKAVKVQGQWEAERARRKEAKAESDRIVEGLNNNVERLKDSLLKANNKISQSRAQGKVVGGRGELQKAEQPEQQNDRDEQTMPDASVKAKEKKKGAGFMTKTVRKVRKAFSLNGDNEMQQKQGELDKQPENDQKQSEKEQRQLESEQRQLESEQRQLESEQGQLESEQRQLESAQRELEDKQADNRKLEEAFQEAETTVSRAGQVVEEWNLRIAELQKKLNESEGNVRILEIRARDCRAELERCQKAASFLEGGMK